MRRFEFREGTSSKFWEVDVSGVAFTVRWGRIGSEGQAKTTSYANAATAQREVDRLVAEKTKKGYRELKSEPATPARTSLVSTGDFGLTQLRAANNWGANLGTVRVRGHLAVTSGSMVLASTDSKNFRARARASPGNTFTLALEDDFWFLAGQDGLAAISKDRGNSWSRVKVPHHGGLFAFFRDSKRTCWLTGDDGAVFRSANPAQGWKRVKVGLPDKVLQVAEIDGRLFMVGSGGGVVGDGTSFKKLPGFSKKVTLTRVTATPSGALVVVGDEGVAFRSTDAGKSWKPVKTGARRADLEDLAWVAGSLFVVGGDGLILESVNEGKTFVKRTFPDGPTHKVWSIGSWGDGAFLAGARGGLYRLASPRDPYWRGTIDEFAPTPPKTPEGFAPGQAISEAERARAFAALSTEAAAGWAKLAAKKRSPPRDDLPEPTRDDEWEIFADALQAKGDPRGELAALQRRLRTNPKDAALKKAERDCFKKHRAHFMGELAGFGDFLTLSWADGFITSARLAHNPDDEDQALSMPEVLAKLVDHPSARFLRELTVGLVTFEENSYDEIIEVLGARSLPSLRSLFLGDFEAEDTEVSWSELGNAQPLYGSLPNLEALTLRSGSMSLGKLIHPTLRSLTLQTGGLSRATFKEVLKATVPSLEVLTLQFGQHNYGGDVEAADLAPLLAGARFPRLKQLGLTNAEFINEAVRLLPTSRLLPQLEVLDLSLGTLGDEGAHSLATFKPAFAHLKRLDLTRNFLSKEGQKLVKDLCADVDLAHQEDDQGNPADRYTAVGE